MPTDLRQLSVAELKKRLAALKAGTDEKAPGAAGKGIPSLQRRLAIDQNRTAGIGQAGLRTIHQDPNSPEAVALRQQRAMALGLANPANHVGNVPPPAPGVSTTATGRTATGTMTNPTTGQQVDPGFYRHDAKAVLAALEAEGPDHVRGMIGKGGGDLEELKRQIRRRSPKRDHSKQALGAASRFGGSQRYTPNGMPYRSAKQRRYIYAAAARGEAWAVKFIRDSGETPPKRKARRARH